MKADEDMYKDEVEKAYKIEKTKDSRYIQKRKFIDTYSNGPSPRKDKVVTN